MNQRLLLVVLALAACSTAPQDRPGREPGRRPVQPDPEIVAAATSDFETLRDAFLSWYLEAYPVRASGLGAYAHAGELPGWDRDDVQLRIDDLLDWLADLEAIPPRVLSAPDRYDHAVLEFALRGELLDLEEARSWTRDPRRYIGTLMAAVATVAESDYAPAAERMAALRSRLEAAPELLAAARRNIDTAPEPWIDLAAADARGLADYLETRLPGAFAGAASSPGTLPSEVLEARDALLDALAGYTEWLETDLRPRPGAEFRLGRYLFERTVLYGEHITLDVSELQRLNARAIEEYRGRLQAVAAGIDPAREPTAILDSLDRIHPEPDQLVEATRSAMLSLADWLRSTDLVDVPDGAPTVRAASWPRAGDAVRLDPVGPFAEDGDGTLDVVVPGSDWTEERATSLLAEFGPASLVPVTAHATFPGRYVQAGHERRVDRPLRAVFTPRSLAEGWSLYAEELALDEGYGDGDPVVRLGQLRRALRMHARWDAVVQLHALGTSIDQAVTRFREIAGVDEATARQEIARASYDPGLLAAALGRLQIQELRDDYMARDEDQGEAPSLRAFHDRLLDLALPLPLAREVILPMADDDTSPTGRR